nr:unnamed protein product [Callosobruchus analis]
MSATGNYVPPFFIFARKRLNPLLIKDAPTGSALSVTDSGYMNSLRFVDYLEHFRKYTSPTAESPILLILDNHISHTSLQAITYAKNNNIHLLSLPPHSSHTQPLDRNLFRPLKAYYDDLCDNRTTSNPGQVVTEYHIAGLFKLAYEKTASIEKAVNGFQMTGIYPLNENIFTEEDFLPSSVTDQADETEEIDDLDKDDRDMHFNVVFEEDRPEGNSVVEANEPTEEADNNLPDRANVSNEQESSTPARLQECESQKSGSSKENTEHLYHSFACIDEKRKRTRKGLKSTLLTSTPNKEELENIDREKKRKVEAKKRRKSTKRNKTAVRNVFGEKYNSVKKNQYQSSSESESQFSLHDSSSDMFSLDSDAESDSSLPGFTSGDFAVVRVCGKTKDSFRLYVMRITAVLDDGFNGIYYKRAPKAMRFFETDEEFFVNRSDITRKLSKPLPSSSARFKDFVSFSTDLSSKEFTHQYTLLRHLPTHTDERKFQCNTCGKESDEKEPLRRSIVTTPAGHIAPIRCTLGPLAAGNLRNHIFTHTNERPYKCDICDKGFNQMSNLMCHKLKAHQRTEKPKYVCQICGDAFPKRMSLRQHEQYSHGMINPPTRSPRLPEKMNKSDNRGLNDSLIDPGSKPIGSTVQIKIPVVATVIQQHESGGQMSMSVMSPGPNGELVDQADMTQTSSNNYSMDKELKDDDMELEENIVL